MFAKGYISGKVWNNGLLKKDVEAVAEGNNNKMHIVVRDKNTISDIIGPTNNVLRTFFSQKTNPIPLEKRLLALTKKSNKVKKTKTKGKSKTKKNKTKVNKTNKANKVKKTKNNAKNKTKGKNKTKKN
jgi:hypothetical protein